MFHRFVAACVCAAALPLLPVLGQTPSAPASNNAPPAGGSVPSGSLPRLAPDPEGLRAQGGGQLRGLLYTVNEAPTGIGGPNSPLVTTAATQSPPGTSVA